MLLLIMMMLLVTMFYNCSAKHNWNINLIFKELASQVVSCPFRWYLYLYLYLYYVFVFVLLFSPLSSSWCNGLPHKKQLQAELLPILDYWSASLASSLWETRGVKNTVGRVIKLQRTREAFEMWSLFCCLKSHLSQILWQTFELLNEWKWKCASAWQNHNGAPRV